MSLLFLKPQYYRPVGVTSLVIGVILALYAYFSATAQGFAGFVGGLLVGVAAVLLTASFGE